MLIACASKFHPRYLREAIDAGRHVFVEKPHGIDPVGVQVGGAVKNVLAVASGKGGVNKLSKIEKQEGWVLLFDGKTLDGWHVYNKGKAQSAWIKAQLDDKVYEQYQFPKDEKQKNGDLDQARSELTKVKMNAEIDLASKAANRMRAKFLNKRCPNRLANSGQSPSSNEPPTTSISRRSSPVVSYSARAS